MFKSIKELQNFILWAKREKVKSLSIDNIKFELSDIGLVEDLEQKSESKDISVPPTSPRLPDGSKQANDEDEMLFWSSRTS